MIKIYHTYLLYKSTIIMIHLGRLWQLFYKTLMQYDFCANRTKKHSRETMSMASKYTNIQRLKKGASRQELTTGRLRKSRREGASGHFSLEMTAQKVLGLPRYWESKDSGLPRLQQMPRVLLNLAKLFFTFHSDPVFTTIATATSFTNNNDNSPPKA